MVEIVKPLTVHGRELGITENLKLVSSDSNANYKQLKIY
jgi:hypothetical protein